MGSHSFTGLSCLNYILMNCLLAQLCLQGVGRVRKSKDEERTLLALFSLGGPRATRAFKTLVTTQTRFCNKCMGGFDSNYKLYSQL